MMFSLLACLGRQPDRPEGGARLRRRLPGPAGPGRWGRQPQRRLHHDVHLPRLPVGRPRAGGQRGGRTLFGLVLRAAASTSFWTGSRAFLSPHPTPHPCRHMLYSVAMLDRGLIGAWESDVVTNLNFGAHFRAGRAGRPRCTSTPGCPTATAPWEGKPSTPATPFRTKPPRRCETHPCRVGPALS